MTAADNTRRAAGRASDQAERAGRDVQSSDAFRLLVRVGLISYGVVHLVVAWLAVQLAWFGRQEEASQQGAFQELASTTLGRITLWVVAVGLFALAVWQLFEALWGHRDREEGRKRTVKRVGSAGKVVLYVALGVSAVRVVTGSSSSGDTQKEMTASLMGSSTGRILVIALGVVVIVAGGRLVYRGLSRKFTRDLAGGVGQGVVRLGQVGYAAKGVVLAIVGALFLLAALTYSPDRAGGLDTALRTLNGQPYGPYLLTALALGIACFGVYCFAWSRHVKQT
ncbi:DUF1206 domain-containing protein [Nakamurella deserti]|uniref:DUF1206 domain-containing protein n=1 Tax=Nakamurella deserti TaxID=2164074 RepID=UPI001F0C1AEA|nr:DUF1206 domain-containing protein [Nakamurella deserti]